MIALVPIIAIVLGALMWALPAPPIIKDMGRIIFACGMLVTLFSSSHTTVSLLGK